MQCMASSNALLGLESGKLPQGLTPEEEDNLARSNKKAKMDMVECSQNNTVVPETPMEIEVPETPMEVGVPDVNDKEEGAKLVVDDEESGRKVFSYKDIILGATRKGEESSSEDGETEYSSGSEDSDHSEGEEEGSFQKNNEGDPFCPEVQISHKEVREACKAWKHSVIIKVLGKKCGLRFLQLRLITMWKPLGDMEIIDMEYEYFLVRFSNPSDYDMVFQGGPWMVTGHYLIVQKWHPQFFPLEDELKRVAVWIRIPGLPMEFYDRNILWRIGDTIGKSVKIVSNTIKPRDGYWGQTTTVRGKFARLCIEVDLRRALISQFRLQGRTYNVEWFALGVGSMATEKRNVRLPTKKMYRVLNLGETNRMTRSICRLQMEDKGERRKVRRKWKPHVDLKGGGSRFAALMDSGEKEEEVIFHVNETIVPVVHPMDVSTPPNRKNSEPAQKVSGPKSVTDLKRAARNGPQTILIQGKITEEHPKANPVTKTVGPTGTQIMEIDGNEENHRSPNDGSVQQVELGQNPPSAQEKTGLNPKLRLTVLKRRGIVLKDFTLAEVPLNLSFASVRDMVDSSGSWRFSEFGHLIPDWILNDIKGTLPPNDQLGPDSLSWGLTTNGNFTTKSAYHLAITSAPLTEFGK
ncbi:hypothetical protein SESBI_16505 [Sesbania bispinosa]|nr:hypothetical protein SESBI_16505 [Sesbania bispinosa]